MTPVVDVQLSRYGDCVLYLISPSLIKMVGIFFSGLGFRSYQVAPLRVTAVQRPYCSYFRAPTKEPATCSTVTGIVFSNGTDHPNRTAPTVAVPRMVT
jgi:hypothetical protein